MSVVLNQILAENELTISTCESMTGGSLAASIVAVSGASKIFRGGLITYQSQAKSLILNKSIDEIEQIKTVSSSMSQILAEKALTTFKSDVAIGITGNAGPLASSQQPVGRVYIAVLVKQSETISAVVKEYNFVGDRASILAQGVDAALILAQQSLENIYRKEQK